MVIMSGGGFVRLPDGSVIVALTLPVPREPHGASAGAADAAAPGTRSAGVPTARRSGLLPASRRWSAFADEPHTVREATVRRPGEEQRVRVLVHAGNRARALTRLRNLGLRAIYLRGNAEPPTADEVTAVLHHPEGLVWRAVPDDDRDSWRPIAALLRVTPA
ncbi:hypothetical protein HC362_20965 [Streptomyces sp. 891-h]|uniref:Uncharacterized protein n=1 Tax=Streptomyces spirodelae TaxID=2812904 RepID=A0ABS3WNX4_9ACTN|nr:hypothetical protein [Streptomyces spirodelae]UNZ19150.1 hypothetical protein HC362_20965 [Streptomyces sp. 891-h]